jgi:hypothetical protein
MPNLYHFVLTDGETRYGSVMLIAEGIEEAQHAIQEMPLDAWLPLPVSVDDLSWELDGDFELPLTLLSTELTRYHESQNHRDRS